MTRRTSKKDTIENAVEDIKKFLEKRIKELQDNCQRENYEQKYSREKNPAAWKTTEKSFEQLKKDRQDKCRHLKGGRGVRNRFACKDYCLMDHTYIDGHRVIKCLLCRKEWLENGLEWDVALKMLETSTNHRSRAEVIFIDDKTVKDLTPGIREMVISALTSSGDVRKKDNRKYTWTPMVNTTAVDEVKPYTETIVIQDKLDKNS